MRVSLQILGFLGFLMFFSSFKSYKIHQSDNSQFNGIQKDSVLTDSIHLDTTLVTYLPFKENAHASYYHDKFTGRKTASGDIFDNNFYTAAHRTLKFGTKVKITNILNNASVIVTINDRGPFVKGREIDLSKKAFMEIAKFKHRGYLIVDIEIIEEEK